MSVSKNTLSIVVGFMVLCAIGLSPGVAAAAEPVILDGPFGDVPLGATSTSAIQVNAPAANAITLTGMSFASGSSSQFIVNTTLPAFGLNLAAGASTLIEVAFMPSVAGLASATLVINTFITSDWTSVPGEIHLNLTGNGLDTQAAQTDTAGASQVQGLLAFFDNAVANGTLEGKGKGKSAKKRIKTVRSLIKSVEKKLKREKPKKACKQLRALSKKTRSHVKGSAKGEFAVRVKQLSIDLGCKKG